MAEDIEEIRREETRANKGRGRKKLSPEMERRIKGLANLLTDPKYSYEKYMEVIEKLKLPYDSDEYHDLVGRSFAANLDSFLFCGFNTPFLFFFRKFFKKSRNNPRELGRKLLFGERRCR